MFTWCKKLFSKQTKHEEWQNDPRNNTVADFRFDVILIIGEDQASRDFLTTLDSEHWTKIKEVVHWYKNSDRVRYYVEEMGYPAAIQSFPAAWVPIPKTHTFADYDQIVLLQGFTTFKDIIDEADGQWVHAMVEQHQMPEYHKRQYIKEQILMNADIPVEIKAQLMSCETVKHLRILYYCLMQENKIKNQETFILDIKNATKVDLGEKIELRRQPKSIALPYMESAH